MTVETHPHRAPIPKGRWLYDARVRSVLYQTLLVVILVAVGWYLISNLLVNLERQNIATGYGFLDREAGFEISESLISYGAADSYGRAFIVGLLNTFQVAILGIVLATILGTLVGIMRLSSNWLLAKVSAVYVEIMRNIPLLLQLFIWYAIITVSMPSPRAALQPFTGLVLSNRGIQMAVPAADPIHPWMWAGLLIGIGLAIGIKIWAKRRQDATGQPFPVALTAAGVIIGLPLAIWVLGGAPTEMSIPELQGFNFRGGRTISPEFAAVLFGLTFYTAAFIAEIVRAGILAVSYGQTEAAAALGLRSNMIMRLVVLPQALRIIIPPTTSQYLNLAKNSSLAVAVGYPDLVSVGNTTLNQTGQAIEAISIFMAVYLSISLSISAFMNWYNKHIALVER
ncbi:amino acid ABC transporter permease [Fodinicurvata sp. EGI_FJ10296]|uniref:amino acid ABC transporter permease n=1 Tax=Fodinicurvata sp. EGI_FJ10296 TaxID=3231908 RepID=UPI003455ADA7